jgi:hypothetical protein
MKTSLEPQQVQSWGLVGIKPMHRALLRNTVERAAPPTSEGASLIELTWTVFDHSANHLHLEIFDRTSVVIIGKDTLSKQFEIDGGNELVNDRYNRRANAQIRLLWNWCQRGREDLMWCTELSFDGVIYDLASMYRWGRVCLKRARVIQSQNHLLLRDLQLPRISPNPSSLV